jgi:hypothetical protein
VGYTSFCERGSGLFIEQKFMFLFVYKQPTRPTSAVMVSKLFNDPSNSSVHALGRVDLADPSWIAAAGKRFGRSLRVWGKAARKH